MTWLGRLRLMSSTLTRPHRSHSVFEIMFQVSFSSYKGKHFNILPIVVEMCHFTAIAC